MLNIEPADILEQAAELYESGKLTWVPNGAGLDGNLCVMQCINKASAQLLGWNGATRVWKFERAREALRTHLGIGENSSRAIIVWNDGLDGVPKNQEIVVEALKGAAKDLRNK